MSTELETFTDRGIMLARSTKGASRQRRELINAEINCIRDLLPLQDGVRKRLSQLQIMAICKALIGKNNFFGKIVDTASVSSDRAEFTSEFSQALPGFLLMATVDGKFLYLSDNIMEVLGNSMVDFITQAETVFDLFDEKGQAKVLELLSGYHGNRSDAYATGEFSSTEEIKFTCLMGLTKNVRRHPGLDRQKFMKVRATLMRPSNGDENSDPVLVALCTPWPTLMPTGEPMSVFNTMVYQTRHTLDMKFLNLDTNGEYHLGYSAKEMQFRSFYELVHPDHENEFAAKHIELISGGVDSYSSVFLRVQTSYGHFIWLHVIMRLIPGNDQSASQPEIVCMNHVINEEELTFMKERELAEAELASYSAQSQMFSNRGNCVPYPTAIVDDRFLVAPAASSVGQLPVWSDSMPPNKRRKTEKAGGYENQLDAWGSDRSMATDDFSSSSGCSSVSFHSPMNSDVDHSFQFASMEAYPSTSCLDAGQMDFNLQTEDHFHLNVPSPNSVFSDSAIGNSPRMFPEDDGSFFNSMTPVTDQGKTSSSLLVMNGSNTSLDDLLELQSCSDMQSVSSELPELSISELNDYLSLMEDCKKDVKISQNLHHLTRKQAVLPAYNWNHNLVQPNQMCQVPKATSSTYNLTTMPRGAEVNFVKPEPEITAKRENLSCLTSERFLERLLESPQFTELVGMLETESQRFQGFPEQGLASYG